MENPLFRTANSAAVAVPPDKALIQTAIAPMLTPILTTTMRKQEYRDAIGPNLSLVDGRLEIM
jgi:hypothetical protein